MLSALCVSHSQNDSGFDEADAAGGALEVAGDGACVSWKIEERVSSIPEVKAVKLDMEASVLVARKLEVSTGSRGVSLGVASVSLCKPVGFSGKRRVPLLGAGWIPIESQMML